MRSLAMTAAEHQPVSCIRLVGVVVVALLGTLVTAARVAGQDGTFEVVAAFDHGTRGGEFPAAGLLHASDGSFYGTTQLGGTRGLGTIFKLDTTGTLTIVHSFTRDDGAYPAGELVQGSDGSIYGATYEPGASDAGTIFKLDAAGALTTLRQFTRADGGGAVGARLVVTSDGTLYGTTVGNGLNRSYGTVFKLAPNGTLTTLHSFTDSDGRSPRAGLIQASDGNLYGTTASGGLGTVFKVDPAGAVTTLSRFGSTNGGAPVTGVFEGNDGRFYGATQSGGASGQGIVFRLDADGTVTPLASLPAVAAGLIQGRDGSFYGTTRTGGANGFGSVFKLDAAGTLTTLHDFTDVDGANPFAGVIEGPDGSFYGTTANGPTRKAFGTIFKLDVNGSLATLHVFKGSSGGRQIESGVTQGRDGSFYGTTIYGGADDIGTVFKLDPTGTLTTLYSVTRTGPAFPGAGVIEASDGNLYGTAVGSGADDYGMVFKLDPAGTLTVVHRFTSTDGAYPRAGLIQASNGSFYGTTESGGAYGQGTVFRLDQDGTLTTLVSFGPDADGRSPTAGVIQAADGNFYGTTVTGGAHGYGTVFKLDWAGTLTTLHSFTLAEGAFPGAGVVQGRDGNFYGTTRNGGASFPATIFRMDPDGTLTTLYGFTGTGGFSIPGPVEGSDGSFYGTTRIGGANNIGTLFRLDPDGTLTTLHSFAWQDGVQPGTAARLILASDGSLYGTTESGGPYGGGVIFRYTPARPVEPPRPVPGRIEAEDYDRGGQGVSYYDSSPGNTPGGYRADDVDIISSREFGYAIGSITAGEWLAYTVDVERDGLYTIAARVGSALPGRTFHIEVDGTDLTGPVGVPQFTEWDTYDTVCLTGVRLRAGRQVLRVVMGPEDYMDFQWLDIQHAIRPGRRDRGALWFGPLQRVPGGWGIIGLSASSRAPQAVQAEPPRRGLPAEIGSRSNPAAGSPSACGPGRTPRE